jgi:hypothetical protein
MYQHILNVVLLQYPNAMAEAARQKKLMAAHLLSAAVSQQQPGTASQQQPASALPRGVLRNAIGTATDSILQMMESHSSAESVQLSDSQRQRGSYRSELFLRYGQLYLDVELGSCLCI